jgi:S-adenosyl-L-methionine hydrolase (adenosine-forming)
MYFNVLCTIDSRALGFSTSFYRIALMNMPIVTLTTDLGLQDYYAALIKGAILCQNEYINIIDISHCISPYNIVQGAFVLGNSYLSFPNGSIHLLFVGNEDSKNQRYIAFKHKEHYFIGPDNGIFTLMFHPMPALVYLIPYFEISAYPLKDVFAQAISHIVREGTTLHIGEVTTDLVTRINLQPVVSKHQIRGTVIYIDSYQNVITNISNGLFEKTRKNRSFSILFKRHEPITAICKHYYHVAVGETLCKFDAAGYLEIAVHMGKAASFHSLQIDDTVQITFEEEA